MSSDKVNQLNAHQLYFGDRAEIFQLFAPGAENAMAGTGGVA
jgi:hypothetical protein